LTEGELLSLCMMTAFLDTLHNTPFAPAVRGALAKLALLLPTPVHAAGGAEQHFITYLPGPIPPERVESAIHFNTLLHAMEARRAVRMTYYTLSRDQESTRTVDPYQLYFHQGMWYLHGWCHQRRATRDFALERLRALEMTAVVFPAPDLAAIRAQLAQRFSIIQDTPLQVVIRFDAGEEARRIRERIWHPSQQLAEHADGGCSLTMTVGGIESVVRWILGFGRHAHVVSPPALVTRIADEVAAMACVPALHG
jgi:predicted DNA-binding transcriptional regulator YafY